MRILEKAMTTKWKFFQWAAYLFIIFLLFNRFVQRTPVFAQGLLTLQFNIARTLVIDDKDAIDGDLMSLEVGKEALVRSAKDSDERMFGVLVADPVMVYRTLPTLPVARDGEAMANVTTLGGPIVVGDYITSSPIPGKGQKGQGVAGYMAGVALGNFDGKGITTTITYQGKKYPVGQVKINVGIGPASPVLTKAAGGLLGTLKQLSTAIIYNISTSQQAEKIIRYILAVLIAVIIFYISYRTFGTNVTKGIEAIGRNPLAKGTIQAMITLNIILLIVSCLAGVALALVIISL